MHISAFDDAGRAGRCRAIGLIATLAVSAAAMSPTGAAARPAVTVTVGGGHACGLTKAGQVECWGSNFYGQLGIGASGDRHNPAMVPGLTGVRAISAGSEHTCIVTKQHGAMCWGDNQYGQLGNGSTTNSFVPVAVQGLEHGVVAIAAGGSHTCALTNGSAVKCWGANASGQLGNNSTTDSSTPVGVRGLNNGVSDIGAGQAHSCALAAGDIVKCWGWNGSGQLGNGVKGGQVATPVVAQGVGGAVGVMVGGDHTCARTAGSAVLCWGENVVGELGDGDTNERTTAARVLGVHSPVIVSSAGSSHTCIVSADKSARCWGNNVYGQIGNGTHNVQTSAVVVKRLGDVTDIAAGNDTTCAILTNGHLKCWGSDEFGQLGDGRSQDSSFPVSVIGF